VDPLFAVTDPSGARVTDAGAFTSSAFIAGIVVSLMIVPTQTSVMREAFSQAPLGEREGALALGSTRWGMIRTVVLPFGRGGIIGGTMLARAGAGRDHRGRDDHLADLHDQLAGAEDRDQLRFGADRSALRRGQPVRFVRPHGGRSRAVHHHADRQLHGIHHRRPQPLGAESN
jgi:hypothetical protein